MGDFFQDGYEKNANVLYENHSVKTYSGRGLKFEAYMFQKGCYFHNIKCCQLGLKFKMADIFQDECHVLQYFIGILCFAHTPIRSPRW